MARLAYDEVTSSNLDGTGNLMTVTTLPNSTNPRVHHLDIDADGELRQVIRNHHLSSGVARLPTTFAYACFDDDESETVDTCESALAERTVLLTRVTDARSSSSAFDYDNSTGEWRHIATVDREGEPWSIDYGTADPNTGARTTVVTSPMGATTSYDISGRDQISSEDPRIAGGNIEAISDAGRLDEQGANQGPVTSSYDWQENRMVARRNGANNQTQMTYNDLGLVTAIDSPPTNQDGQRVITTFDYSPAEFSYGAECGPVAPDGEGDRVTNDMACDTVAELDRTIAAKDSEGQARATDFFYDSDGNLTRTIARREAATPHDASRQTDERETTMTYHGFGGLAAVDGPRHFPDGQPEDVTTFWAYHDSGQPTMITDARGKDISMFFTPYGAPTSTTDRGDRTTKATYDQLDRPLRQESPDGDVTTFTYDSNGNRATVTSPRGNDTTTTGDFTTTFTYDLMDRPTRTSSPGATVSDNIVTTTTYNADGTVATETNPVGAQTRFTYHPNRMLASTSVPVAHAIRGVTDVFYDAAGRERKVVAPQVNAAGQRPVTTTTYTPASGVDTTTSTNWDSSTRDVSYAYSSHGEVTEVTGPRSGQLRTQELNSYGEITSLTTKVSDHKTLRYSNSYDLAGNKTSYMQPDGDGQTMTTSFTYDVLSRLVHQTDPQNPGHTTEYDYLPEGQQTLRFDYHTPSGGTKTLQRRIETAYNLDYTSKSTVSTDLAKAGQPTLALYHYEPGDPSSGYDSNDNPLAVHTRCSGGECGSGRILAGRMMFYDHADRMEVLRQYIDIPGGGAVGRAQELTYRADSRLATSKWQGETTTYQHSGGGYLTGVTDWRNDPETSTMSYFSSGAAKEVELGGSAIETVDYHPDGSLANLLWTAEGINTVRRHNEITYNAAGLRTGEDVFVRSPLSGEDSGGPADFDYDLAGRLTSWTSPFRLDFGDIAGPDNPTTAYTLDDAGNISHQEVTAGGQTWEEVTASFTNARLDRRDVINRSLVEVGSETETLTATTTQDFGYSHLGEETDRDATTSYAVTGDATPPPDESLKTMSAYDPAGTTRAQTHTGDRPPRDVTYFYDGQGRVIARKTSQKTTYFYYFGNSSRLAEEKVLGSSEGVEYLNDPSGRILAEEHDEDTWVWLLGDPDGNVATELEVLDGQYEHPDIKRQRAYDPYGSPDEGGISEDLGAGKESTLGYQGDNTDPDTGNLLLGPRLYDPEVNRFTSPDVFAAAGADMALGTDPLTGNRYFFAAANPVAFYDDGHRPEPFTCDGRTYCSASSGSGPRDSRSGEGDSPPGKPKVQSWITYGPRETTVTTGPVTVDVSGSMTIVTPHPTRYEVVVHLWIGGVQKFGETAGIASYYESFGGRIESENDEMPLREDRSSEQTAFNKFGGIDSSTTFVSEMPRNHGRPTLVSFELLTLTNNPEGLGLPVGNFFGGNDYVIDLTRVDERR